MKTFMIIVGLLYVVAAMVGFLSIAGVLFDSKTFFFLGQGGGSWGPYLALLVAGATLTVAGWKYRE